MKSCQCRDYIRLFFIVALGSCLLASCRADAATIYSQTPVINGGLMSDADPIKPPEVPFFVTRYAADDFTLVGAATVTSMLWRGVDFGVPAPDDFTVNFYTGASSPDALLESFDIGSPSSRIDTGLDWPDGDVVGGDIFEYVAELGSGISLSSSTTYWISIFNNTVGDGDFDYWAWAGNTSASTGANSVYSSDLSGWLTVTGTGSPSFLAEELYFQFNSTAVPIPAAMWLFGSALGLLGWMRRKAA